MEGYISSCHLLLAFLIFTALLLVSPPVSAASQSQHYKTFIRTSCNVTTYPALCYKTLSPYATTIKLDPWSLCNAALSAAVTAAQKSSSTVLKLAKKKRLKAREAAVIWDCIENIQDSIEELKQSANAMRGIGGSEDKRFEMANIKTWISAAITDQDTCTDGFVDSEVSGNVKKKINRRISMFIGVASNALSLLNQLSY
ncbi:21 kDa protein-like [Diospyros lotus]|uniref:21 kDa protein-like n=1 Tax=Diospyros lotus TaxID=55363 RepID=UPI00225AA925|nr:21 kDa protein-like [Diospyros lotus]